MSHLEINRNFPFTNSLDYNKRTLPGSIYFKGEGQKYCIIQISIMLKEENDLDS